MKSSTSISVIGLGKLGLPFAAFYAQKCQVYALDKSEHRMRLLEPSSSESSIEPDVVSLLTAYKKNIHPVNKVDEAVKKSEITFIIVPTPSKRNGSFALDFVLTAIKEVGEVLRHKLKRHIVVLVSTRAGGWPQNWAYFRILLRS